MPNTERTYRLGSNEGVYTPNIVRWCQAHWGYKPDRPKLLQTMASWRNEAGLPTDDDFRKLLSNEVPFTVENEAVVFTV